MLSSSGRAIVSGCFAVLLMLGNVREGLPSLCAASVNISVLLWNLPVCWSKHKSSFAMELYPWTPLCSAAWKWPIGHAQDEGTRVWPTSQLLRSVHILSGPQETYSSIQHLQASHSDPQTVPWAEREGSLLQFRCKSTGRKKKQWAYIRNVQHSDGSAN